jgi:hypothetical protein
MTKAIAVQCKAISKSTGERCKAKAIRGGEVCRHHGAGAPQVKAKAALKADVLDWGLGDIALDLSEVLLRLVTQSYRRAEMYAAELKALVDETGLRDALVMEKWSATEQGDTYKVGEEIRGLARLEADERERCAGFAAKAVAAGLIKKQTDLAQLQGEMLVTALQAVLDKVALTQEQQAQVKDALRTIELPAA